MGFRRKGIEAALKGVGIDPTGATSKVSRAAAWGGGWGVRAGIFAANPAVGTLAGIGEGTYRAGKALRRGVRDTIGSPTPGTDPIGKARNFAYRRPGVTAAGIAAMAGPAIYSGGPGSGSRASSGNQNSYYVRRMRSGQSSGVAGIDPRSLGGFA